MSRRVVALAALVLVGTFLLLASVKVGLTIGSEWFGASASSPWHMNNYIVVDAKYAFIYFGLGALALGGLATGLAAPGFFASKRNKISKIAAVSSFFVAIVLTGLGFNTLDFMSGNFYWTNLHYPPPVKVPIIGSVDVWNYYFFFFVVPLWLGGFIIGTITSYHTFIHKPKHSAYRANVDFPMVIRQSAQITKGGEYIIETAAFSRNSKTSNFSNSNANFLEQRVFNKLALPNHAKKLQQTKNDGKLAS